MLPDKGSVIILNSQTGIRYPYSTAVCMYTVELLITHTPPWMAQAMGYYRLWVSKGVLKIESKKSPKNRKNC
jgi:hypothetical protein